MRTNKGQEFVIGGYMPGPQGVDSISVGPTAKCQAKGQTSWTAAQDSGHERVAARRAQGVGWKRIAAEMGVGVGTIYRVTLEGSKTLENDSGTAVGLRTGRFVP